MSNLKETKWTPEFKKEYSHIHYINNKDKYIESAIKNHWLDMIYCEHCDKSYVKKYYNKHIESKTHLFNKEFGNGPKITCKLCNSTIRRNNYRIHIKTKIHIENEK